MGEPLRTIIQSRASVVARPARLEMMMRAGLRASTGVPDRPDPAGKIGSPTPALPASSRRGPR
jgi:hypothetical protein